MKQSFTLDWLKTTPAARLNQHLFKEVREKKARRPSKHVLWMEEALTDWCKEKGYTLKTEHRFNPTRKYKFDFAILELMIACEFEGGIWMKGGGAHSRPAAIERDIHKYNLAQSDGWDVLRFHSNTYRTVIEELEKHIK
jgi:very-short-patch-repair endonuclease